MNFLLLASGCLANGKAQERSKVYPQSVWILLINGHLFCHSHLHDSLIMHSFPLIAPSWPLQSDSDNELRWCRSKVLQDLLCFPKPYSIPYWICHFIKLSSNFSIWMSHLFSAGNLMDTRSWLSLSFTFLSLIFFFSPFSSLFGIFLLSFLSSLLHSFHSISILFQGRDLIANGQELQKLKAYYFKRKEKHNFASIRGAN